MKKKDHSSLFKGNCVEGLTNRLRQTKVGEIIVIPEFQVKGSHAIAKQIGMKISVRKISILEHALKRLA